MDLLKIDIEGFEWQALPEMLKSAKGKLPISQLQVNSVHIHLSSNIASGEG